ncbi:MAG TPA: hypothetical protein VGH56_04280 [Solirubrobacteraceae bacterium]
MSYVRGLQTTLCQLALPVGGSGPVSRVWESFTPEARERVLHVLAGVIGRLVTADEERR